MAFDEQTDEATDALFRVWKALRSGPQQAMGRDISQVVAATREALEGAYVAMKLASALPGVQREYDFQPALDKAAKELGFVGPRCAYCGTAAGLRRVHDGYGCIAPEFTCETCFTGQDDGPCFDDLPAA